MQYSQGSSWSSCCQHEQQISILQQKIMQVHNKLIDQLDICKQQEITIMELTKQLQENQQINSQQFDTFNYQSFGQGRPQGKENIPTNHKIYYDHDSRQSHQTKNELLQADLEAMRNKVLMEITEKNKLKEDIRDIKNQHKREISQYLKKNQELQQQLERTKENYEELQDRVERIRRGKRVEIDIQKMTLKMSELENKWQREKELNKQLLNQKIKLEEKLLVKQKNNEEILERRVRKEINQTNPVLLQQKQIDNLKVQIQKLNKNIEVRDAEFKSKGEERKRKRGFEETKDLIRRLQQTEINMRKNRRQVGVV